MALVQARHLFIEWMGEGIARTITPAPNPLTMETAGDGALVIETTIFQDFHPWLGIRLGPEGASLVPVLARPSGEETPLLRLEGGAGEVWWVCQDGWDPNARRHLSELQRSAGLYTLRVGEVALRVQVNVSGLDGAEVQAYIDQFRGDLLWIVTNDLAAAVARGQAGGSGAELSGALGRMQAAAQRVAMSPAVAIREGQGRQPVTRLKPTAGTFREHGYQPLARELAGRVFSESADIAENRYLRHMLAVAMNLARAYLSGAARRLHLLDEVSTGERQRASENRGVESRLVNPGVFDAQTRETAQRLEQLGRYRDEGGGEGRTSTLPLLLRNRFGAQPGFFYEPQEGAGSRSQGNIEFRVVIFPQAAFEAIQGVLHVCKAFTITGKARSRLEQARSGKQYLRLEFDGVQCIEPQTDVLERRARKRRGLEEKGWRVPLSENEKRELRREAEIAERRAQRAHDQHQQVAASVNAIERLLAMLAQSDARLAAAGVASSSIFPLGMRFVSNPDYAACMAAFRTLRAYLDKGGLDQEKLEEISRIGILHASDIYEKWCLLKILSLLVEDFRFEPEVDWVQKLVINALGRAHDVRFRLSRSNPDLELVLTWQAQAATGRRPDFLLELAAPRGKGFTAELQKPPALVMDAKFRRSWKPGELAATLDELVLTKGYDKLAEDAMVFILQPGESTVARPASPLDWGPHCDYGSSASHRRGWIQLGLASCTGGGTLHLQRLLAMLFQQAFSAPQEAIGTPEPSWTSPSFCVGCGHEHVSSAIRTAVTSGGARRWQLNCPACRVWTVRTHCYSCRAPLFKNGTLWTYHHTLADQVTNVICPDCGAYFDAAWS